MSSAVCDSSALVAALADVEPEGEWAAQVLRGRSLIGPSLVRFESANILRRHEAAGLISRDQAAQAHADLLDLHVQEWPYDSLAARAWQLRANLTMYDASYVALAELLDAPLVTLDRRMKRAPGIRCQVLTPPDE